MFMRFRGGGVGHHTIRNATNQFLHDRDPSDTISATGSSCLRDEDNGLDDDEQMLLDDAAEDLEEEGLGDSSEEDSDDDSSSGEESDSGDDSDDAEGNDEPEGAVDYGAL